MQNKRTFAESFRRLENRTLLRVQCKEGGWEEIKNSIADVGSSALNAGNEAAQAVINSPTAASIQAAIDRGKQISAADVLGKFDSTGGFHTPDYINTGAERIANALSDPQMRTRLMYAAGGAAGFAALSAAARRLRGRSKKEAAYAKLADLEAIKAAVAEKANELANSDVGQRVQSAVGGAVDSIKGKAVSSGIADKASKYSEQAMAKLKQYAESIKAGLKDPAMRPYVTTALGAAVGGSAGMLAEALSGRRQKRYLNSALTGAAGGGLIGGAYGALTPTGPGKPAPPSTFSDPTGDPLETAAAELAGSLTNATSEEQSSMLADMAKREQAAQPNMLQSGWDALSNVPGAQNTVIGTAGANAAGYGWAKRNFKKELADLGQHIPSLQGQIKQLDGLKLAPQSEGGAALRDAQTKLQGIHKDLQARKGLGVYGGKGSRLGRHGGRLAIGMAAGAIAPEIYRGIRNSLSSIPEAAAPAKYDAVNDAIASAGGF